MLLQAIKPLILLISLVGAVMDKWVSLMHAWSPHADSVHNQLKLHLLNINIKFYYALSITKIMYSWVLLLLLLLLLLQEDWPHPKWGKVCLFS